MELSFDLSYSRINSRVKGAIVKILREGRCLTKDNLSSCKNSRLIFSCSSFVGRQDSRWGRMQLVSIGDNCGFRGITTHEVSYTLFFFLCL